MAEPLQPLSAAARGFDFFDVYAIGLLAVGLAVLIAVLALSRQDERPFSAAVIYLVMGAIASTGLALLGVDLLDPVADATLIERAAEVAVIIALFSAGVRLDRPLGWRQWSSTRRLIIVVMPLTIAAVAVFGSTVMGLSLGAAIILGAVLAPTDPVLAGDVQVGPPGQGEEPETHFALTSEAGLNDGLAFPFLFLGIFVAGDGDGWWLEWLLADVIYAIVAGILIGAVAGYGLSAAISHLRRRGWLHGDYDGWIAIAAVLAVYGLTETLGAYGFLAAFAGGLAFRRRERSHEYQARVHHGAETVEKLSELALVLLLGSTVTTVGLTKPGLEGWLLVPVLLLAIRPAAVAFAFARSRLSTAQRLFIAWFGVRGIGSFYYVAVAIGTGVLTVAESQQIYWTVIACAGISIIAHGITSTPFSRRLEAAER